MGVTATVDGHEVQVGGPSMLGAARAAASTSRAASDAAERTDAPAWRARAAASTSAGAAARAATDAAARAATDAGTQLQPLSETDAWTSAASTVLHVLVDGRVAGAIALADEVRPESRDAVAALRARGVEIVMITGDAEPVARSVAAELGIERVFADVRPGDKSAKVAALQHEGRRVAMVGDGVNDAPALARADVGIAIGAGTDVAIASAGVILASDDPRSVLSVITLSKASYRKMTQNLWWAAGYNLLSVPLAAGVLAPIGFVLPMAVGAILMSLSTIIVAANAQLLRRLDLRPARIGA
jgi:Cu2+-exporting ATPase